MTPIADIGGLVERVRDGFDAGALRTAESRREQLQQLRLMLTEREDELTAALHADLGKPAIEAYGAEIGFTINEIDHTLDHLADWMSASKTKVPMVLKPGSAKVRPEPLGVACVIAPWNYPVQLLLAPVVAAISAGNTVVLKPSEVTPTVAQAITDLLPLYLDEQVAAVVNGAVEETTELLKQRFDHIFYTGNGMVGRIVMRAAAEHLTPVTLELGGKSPAIVDADADIDVAAKRIAWGKFLNAGQTCVAPDYVLVDERVETQLLDALADAVTSFYGEDPKQSSDYARIVNERHHDRLTALLDGGGYDASVVGGVHDRDSRYFAPTVLAGVKPEAAVMDDEIFGPILPVLSVADVGEAIRFVNDRDKPLALYAFSSSDDTLDRIVAQTSSGGVALNHTVLHLAVPELPFGGVGPSGMGAYHGRTGFDTFSHHKAILDKPTWIDPPVMYPPYASWKERLTRKLL